MPKVKSQKLWGFSGAFDKQVKSAWRRGALGLTLADYPCTKIIRKRRHIKKQATPRQRLWRDRWGRIGKAFDEMPACQHELFWQYYQTKRHDEISHQKDKRTAGREHLNKTCKYLSMKALWHKLATRGLLGEFLTEYLKTRLVLLDIDRSQPCKVILHIAMIGQGDEMPEEGLRELKVIRHKT